MNSGSGICHVWVYVDVRVRKRERISRMERGGKRKRGKRGSEESEGWGKTEKESVREHVLYASTFQCAFVFTLLSFFSFSHFSTMQEVKSICGLNFYETRS